MKRGRKPLTPDEKVARGTFRPHRDADKVQLVVSNNGPVMPEHMMDDDNPLAVIARSIWNELHPLVTALGISECDSAMFARYCFLEADVRAAFAAGRVPRSANLTTLRQLEECLRIAGPRSRIGQKSKDAANPFANNGARAKST